MKHKTATLQWASLDHAVAKAAQLKVVIRHGGQPAIAKPFDPEGPAHEFDSNAGVMYLHFKPSTDWGDGGPVIEREKIAIHESCDHWVAGYGIRPEEGIFYSEETGSGPMSIVFDGAAGFGPTPLVAAMRAYVTKAFGEEVELP